MPGNFLQPHRPGIFFVAVDSRCSERNRRPSWAWISAFGVGVRVVMDVYSWLVGWLVGWWLSNSPASVLKMTRFGDKPKTSHVLGEPFSTGGKK